MKRVPNFSAFLKKIIRNSIKNSIFRLKVRGTLKLKTNRNYYVYEEAHPLANTSLFTLELF